MNKKILNLSERKTLIKCMNNLPYTEYWCFNSKIVEVKKFWCALNRLYGIRYFSDIIDLITSYIKDSGSEFKENRIKRCERLSMEFLVFLCSRSNLLEN